MSVMSGVHQILEENLPEGCESIEDAMRDYEADYWKNPITGELHAEWRKVETYNTTYEELEKAISELEWEIEKDMKLVKELKELISIRKGE